MPTPPLAVLFDLDGTLVQTREASWKIFERVNAAFELGVASQEQYFRLLEDNLFHGIRRLCRDDAHSQEVARYFLAELEAHYEPDFVPGMADVVRTLAADCSLAVVSSNSTTTIRRLLTRAKVAHCFSHVFGGDVEPDKRAVVRRFLADASYLASRDCSPAYREGDRKTQASAADLVLVTDTTGDVKHARECGVRVVGVAWGMHPEQHLIEAGAEFVAVWPQELIAHLLSAGPGSRACGVPASQACGCGAATAGSCRCGDGELAEVGAVRRARSLKRAGALAASLATAPPDVALPPPRVPPRADVALLRSLARLRATPPPKLPEPSRNP
jgi:phosphoglycolate phosphatase